MSTGVFYSPGWDSWEEDLYVEIHIPSWMVDDGDWRSVFQQESRKEWSRTGLGSANAKNMPSSSRWNCSDIAAVEMVIAPYSFCTCSLYVLSTFSLVTPTLITSFPQGNLSGQNGFFFPPLICWSQVTRWEIKCIKFLLLFQILSWLPEVWH